MRRTSTGTDQLKLCRWIAAWMVVFDPVLGASMRKELNRATMS
jgi:hypothetical protein